MAYDSEKTGRSWVVSIASKSNVDSLKTGNGIAIRRGKTEAQPEVVEKLSEGAARGVTGNPFFKYENAPLGIPNYGGTIGNDFSGIGYDLRNLNLGGN